MSEAQENYLTELEKLVEENHKAFQRAKRILAEMRKLGPGQAGASDPAAPATRQSSTCSTGIQGKSDPHDDAWLHLPRLARVEVTSQAPSHPVTAALLDDSLTGWRALEAGEQAIRLTFSSPQSVRRILLEFREEEVERTQEFVLRWLPQGAVELRDVVRQQYVFAPHGSTREIEDYRVDLPNVVAIELRIRPDLSGSSGLAALSKWRMA
jgi:hypothetical protein